MSDKINKRTSTTEVKRGKAADQNETLKEFIIRMAEAKQSNSTDSIIMQTILRKIGFPTAIVVSGIAYLECRGIIQAPPISIHALAKQIKNARWS